MAETVSMSFLRQCGSSEETQEEKYWLFKLAEETFHDDRNAQKAVEEQSTCCG